MSRALIVLWGAISKAKAIKWITLAPAGTRLTFQGPKRTIPQNDKMWAMLTDVSLQKEHLGRKYKPFEWKYIFMSALGHQVRYLPSLDGESFIPIGLSSSDLSIAEASDLITFILSWGDENGILWSDPKEENEPVHERVGWKNPR